VSPSEAILEAALFQFCIFSTNKILL